MNIPLVDLKAQYITIKDEINQAVQSVIDSTTFILGEELDRFEHEFAQFCGVNFAVGTSSGTTAIHTALDALGIGPGDEVITTPMTFIATSAEITHAGARPVFVDIEPDSFTIDVKKIHEVIESNYFFNHEIGWLVNRVTQRRLKAVMPVHLYGQMANMSPILEVARQYHLTVIEDAAQAHGAQYYTTDDRSQRAGSLGRVGCFSFYPGKNLGAYGDAGAVVTDDPDLAVRMRLFTDQGRKDKYTHLFEGRNYRLDTIQAAILRVKLRCLDQWNQRRRENAKAYDVLFREVAGVKTPVVMAYGCPVYHLYVLRVQRRDEVFRRVQDSGIGVGIHYPLPLHLQPAYRYLGHRPGDFPVAESCAGEVISLPVYPELTEAQIERIAGAVTSAVSQRCCG